MLRFQDELYGALGEFIDAGAVGRPFWASVGGSGVQVYRLMHPNKATVIGVLFLQLVEGPEGEGGKQIMKVWRPDADGKFGLGDAAELLRIELEDPEFLDRLRVVLVQFGVFRA